jgi:crotonobetainyl-CoA:carnitine CoA-transferase CaiB-like acyl-CoA transferase
MDFLKNITVLSLEQATVLPFLTYRLAHDGIQVYRLEHPVYGDPNRLVGENVVGEDRMNAYYLCINAGKKALTLNLADARGKEMLYKLLQELDVDIFTTNQLPKSYKKLGIDYESMKKAKPDLIWLGATGFGPDSNEPAYDPILQARSGLMELTGEKQGEPMVLGIPLPDMGTSEHGYGQLMKALFRREVSGKGSCIELSMYESSLSWVTVPITLTKLGRHVTRRGNTHEFFAPLSVYQTTDGYVYLAVGNDRQWQAMVTEDLFKSLDKPEYKTNAGRIADVMNLNDGISAVTKAHTTEEMLDFFRSIAVPVSKIYDIEDVLNDPFVQARTLHAKDDKSGVEITMPPSPYLTSFLKEQNRTLSFPPRFGEHNMEVYGKVFGYTEEEVAHLKKDGII